MGAVACDRHRFPQSNIILDEGDDIFIKLSVTNCGTGEQGNFFFKIKIDGTDCATKYNELLYPGENASEVLRCDVVMGTSIIVFEQIGGHYNYDTGTWDEDFHYEYQLKPRTYTLDISPTTHSSPYYGDSFEITVSSDTTWIVYDYESWIQFTPSSGDGNGSITVTVNENPGTASRTGRIYVTHDGMTRSCIITQAGVPCECSSWIDRECIDDTHRRQTRTCTPPGCDIEERTVYDASCYTPCSEYTTESSCIGAGCFWYDGACHDYGPVQCSDYTDALTCVANNCYWWLDGTCHDTEEPNGLPTLLLVPTKTTLLLDGELCPEVECERGIDNVCIYIDSVKTTNCANSGIKANIRCKTLIYPNDFDKISGASLGIGTHTLQAKSPNASDSNVVDITVTEAELYIESCTPTEISNGTYGTGFTDLTFNATAKNNTSAHAYIFFRLTRKGGVSILDEEPDSQALPPFYIGADDTQDVALGVPSIQEIFAVLEDEWIRVDLWQSNINWGDKKLVDSVEIKVGNPELPPDENEESIWKIIADLLGLTVPQVKAIAMAGGGLLALYFILPLLRR